MMFGLPVNCARVSSADFGSENLNAPAGGQAYAYAITDDGSIASKAKFTSNAPFHAFNTLGQPFNLASDALDLGTMGGTASEAWDMHEVNGIVGRSQIASGYWRGFLLRVCDEKVTTLSAGASVLLLGRLYPYRYKFAIRSRRDKRQ